MTALAVFSPDVERSRSSQGSGDSFQVFLRFRRHKVVTVVLNTEHAVDYFHDAPGKAHSRSSAVRIAEVENAGKGDEREKTPGADGGYLWRMETGGGSRRATAAFTCRAKWLR